MRSLLALFLLLTLPISLPAVQSSSMETKPLSWPEIDRLIEEQKLEQASQEVAKVLAAARKAGNEADWTRALTRETQLRIGLSGFETAVRFLKEEPWPQGEIPRVTLNLFYAHALVSYARAYSWEIGQREKTETAGAVDLKAWTREQILAAAEAAYLEIWQQRATLGDVPVSRLAPDLEPNNYPAEVRGTLRDAVSYLFAELLADTSFWTPRESNEVYRLDLSQLLATAGTEFPATGHPLEKAVAVLADLESWHAAQGKAGRAGSLEARLERLRRLHGAFGDEADRARIRGDLAARLPAFREIPWWAMGMADLAAFEQERDDPAPLVRARETARAGWEAYPDSPGGQRCRQIALGIEAPDFQIQTMLADGAGRRSIEVTHRNLEQLYFRAYPLDLAQRLRTADSSLLPNHQELLRLVRQRAAYAWKADLPPTPDFASHRTYVVPPMQEPGAWMVAISARQDFAAAGNRLLSATLTIGDLVLLARSTAEGRLEALTLSGTTGQPLAGAEVRLFLRDWNRNRSNEVALGTSDAQGTVPLPAGTTPGSYFLIARRGAEVAHFDGVPGTFRQPTRPPTASLLYTDRSVYRPAQKLLWKVLAYQQAAESSARFNPKVKIPAKISLHDPNGEEVASATVTTNEFGTASGELAIPPGRPLGAWTLRSSLGGQTQVRVEEYKRPTFEVTFEAPADPLRLNRPATFGGEARYYFGLPVTNGTVRWRAVREPVWPTWWSEWGWWIPRSHWSGDSQTVAAGTVELGEDGKFQVAFTPQADERSASDREVSWRYRLTAEVTDEGGETREAERAFRLGLTAVEAKIEPRTELIRAGQPAAVTVTRSDLDGTPRAGEGTWRLLALQAPDRALLPAEQPLPPRRPGDPVRFETPGDRLRPRWQPLAAPLSTLRLWSDGREIARGTAKHGENGQAELELPKLPPGAWRLRYETTDAFGGRFETFRDLIVAGDRETPLALPLVLLAESATVKVGERARFLAHSGIAGLPLRFERYRGGARVEQRWLTAGKDGSLLEVPVGPEDRGGFSVRLTAVRDHQLLDQTAAVFVPWDDRELQLELSTFRDKIRPGSRETWRVTVRSGGSALAETAEVLASMYDRSLDLFAPYVPPRLLDLYPTRTGTSWSGTSLGGRSASWISQEGWAEVPGGPDLHSDRLTVFDRYGIGGPGRLLAFKRGGSMAEAMEMAAPMPAAQATDKLWVGTEANVSFEETRVPPPPPPPPPAAETALRSDFAETAFWQPHLLTGEDGSAAIEFTVPDSVTAWNVWLHAVTKDLRSGSLRKETRSAKELLVRPYLPRFLREGDRAELKVVVNNTTGRELRGEVRLDVRDPDTDADLLAELGLTAAAARQPFTVPAGGGTSLTFPVTAPRRVGDLAFQVVATAGDVSDGERRPLPLLPSRLHLAQSRFVALKGAERRTMSFPDLARNDDSTRIDEQLVVTVDGQLFTGMLAALPYLASYPYECTEQTLNRFLSTGIVTSLFDRYPAVAAMAQELAKRESAFEAWDAGDPNRQMSLEETPWLRPSRGQGTTDSELIKVLDPRIAKAQRADALAKLQKAQLSTGAFPWWSGGPPSPYMTLYLLHGFAKAAEFQVEMPPAAKDSVVKGWGYLARHYREEYAKRIAAKAKEGCCFELLTFLNYVASAYPDPSWMGDALTEKERKEILDFSFRHWKQHSPYLKLYLALTLQRMGRPKDARLVFDSVMDSAKTTRDEGTFWQPEDRAWLWYEDSIETHAFALRAMTELAPADPRREGLVQWLFLNKQLNHWKSTRATAEVLYALAHYLEKEKLLGVREAVKVTAFPQTVEFVFEPDRYTGKENRVIVPGAKLDPAKSSTVTVEKTTPGFAFAAATWHFSTEALPKEERGDLFQVSRRYFQRVQSGEETVLRPLSEGTLLQPGDEIEVQLSLRSRAAAEYVHLRDPRPAGCEPEGVRSGYRWDLGLARYEEIRDSGTNFFFEALPPGEYTLKYRLRANLAGTFRVGPATLQSMYAPEFTAYSTGEVVKIGEQ